MSLQYYLPENYIGQNSNRTLEQRVSNIEELLINGQTYESYGEWAFGPEEYVRSGTRVLGWANKNIKLQSIRLGIAQVNSGVVLNGSILIAGLAPIAFAFNTVSSSLTTINKESSNISIPKNTKISVTITGLGAYATNLQGLRVDLFGISY